MFFISYCALIFHDVEQIESGLNKGEAIVVRLLKHLLLFSLVKSLLPSLFGYYYLIFFTQALALFLLGYNESLFERLINFLIKPFYYSALFYPIFLLIFEQSFSSKILLFFYCAMALNTLRRSYGTKLFLYSPVLARYFFSFESYFSDFCQKTFSASGFFMNYFLPLGPFLIASFQRYLFSAHLTALFFPSLKQRIQACYEELFACPFEDSEMTATEKNALIALKNSRHDQQHYPVISDLPASQREAGITKFCSLLHDEPSRLTLNFSFFYKEEFQRIYCKDVLDFESSKQIKKSFFHRLEKRFPNSNRAVLRALESTDLSLLRTDQFNVLRMSIKKLLLFDLDLLQEHFSSKSVQSYQRNAQIIEKMKKDIAIIDSLLAKQTSFSPFDDSEFQDHHDSFVNAFYSMMAMSDLLANKISFLFDSMDKAGKNDFITLQAQREAKENLQDSIGQMNHFLQRYQSSFEELDENMCYGYLERTLKAFIDPFLKNPLIVSFYQLLDQHILEFSRDKENLKLSSHFLESSLRNLLPENFSSIISLGSTAIAFENFDPNAFFLSFMGPMMPDKNDLEHHHALEKVSKEIAQVLTPLLWSSYLDNFRPHSLHFDDYKFLSLSSSDLYLLAIDFKDKNNIVGLWNILYKNYAQPSLTTLFGATLYKELEYRGQSLKIFEHVFSLPLETVREFRKRYLFPLKQMILDRCDYEPLKGNEALALEKSTLDFEQLCYNMLLYQLYTQGLILCPEFSQSRPWRGHNIFKKQPQELLKTGEEHLDLLKEGTVVIRDADDLEQSRREPASNRQQLFSPRQFLLSLSSASIAGQCTRLIKKILL